MEEFMRTNYRKLIPINKCNACGITKEEISELCSNPKRYLEVDHINGNHQDNRIDNLMVLCKFCHSIKSKYYGLYTQNIPEIWEEILNYKVINKARHRILKNTAKKKLSMYIEKDITGGSNAN
tara:strand:+ start:894 stop:1262 length:369 start_codon:yes stop_codon:yes gene_type:complete